MTLFINIFSNLRLKGVKLPLGSLTPKWLLLALLFGFFIPTAAHASVSLGDFNTGGGAGAMVGYWPLNETTGSVLRDQSGAGGTATLTGSPSVVAGKFGNARSFTGSPQIASTTLAWPSNSGSISVWVYPTSYSDWVSPAGWKLLGTNNGYILLDEGGSGSPGKWRAVFKANNAGNTEVDVLATANITQNAWQHLVMTWSLSGGVYTVKLYVNSVLQSTGTWTGTLGTSGVGHFHFGNSGDFADNYFLGKVDDVRVYNYAMTPAQIKTIYTVGVPATTIAHSTSPATGQPTLSSGLVGYWSMDGSTINWATGKVNDLSGQGNTGNLISMSTSTSPVAGKIGQALNFSETSHVTYVTVPDSASLELTAQATISLWINAYGSSFVNFPIVGKTNGGGSYEIDFFSAGQWKFVATGASNGTIQGQLVATPNTGWQHIVATYDGAHIVEYLNGKLVSNVAATGTFTTSASAFIIGSASGTGGFNGSIDDVRVYNRALSAAEVGQLYATGAANVAHSNTTTLASGLVGYWTMDGSKINWAKNQVADSSGQGNTGQMLSMSTSTSPTAGKIGQGLKFNSATAQEISLGIAPASLTFAYNQPFSISVWAKPSATVGSGVFDRLVSIAATANKFEYFIMANNSTFSFNIGKNNVGDASVAGSTFTLGQWYHLVGVYDGTNIALYINGVKIGTAAYTFGALSPPDGVLSIGGAGATGNTFNGSLDDVRIYNRALSAQEVSQLYASQK